MLQWAASWALIGPLVMPVINISKESHNQLKAACKARGVKLTYAAERAVLLYLRNRRKKKGG